MRERLHHFLYEIYQFLSFYLVMRLVADIKFYIQKICIEGCSVKLIDDIVCRREPDGISKSYNEQRIAEHQRVLATYLPLGARSDYDTLKRLDKTTLYKLFQLLENPKSLKWLTYLIKTIYRIKK